MSLITVVATGNFISFVSDGLANDNGKIVIEDVKKIKRISKDIIIGSVGSYNQCESVKEIAPYWLEQVNGDLDEFARTLREVVLRDIPKSRFPNLKTNTIVGGLNKNKEIVVYIFTNDENYNLNHTIIKADMKGTFALGTNANIAIDEIDELLKNIDRNLIEEIQLVQEIVNSKIADNKTVNTIVTKEFVQKI